MNNSKVALENSSVTGVARGNAKYGSKKNASADWSNIMKESCRCGHAWTSHKEAPEKNNPRSGGKCSQCACSSYDHDMKNASKKFKPTDFISPADTKRKTK